MPDDRAADEARMLAIFGRRRFRTVEPKPKPDPPTTRPKPKPPTTRPTPPPPTSTPRPPPPPDDRPARLREGPMGLLDVSKERSWEATLSPKELELWNKLKELLSEAGPEMRWRAAGWVMRMELQYARKCLRIAQNLKKETFKAELIQRNGIEFRQAIEALEAKLAGLYDIHVPLAALLGDVDKAHARISMMKTQLGAVTGPWVTSWPGAEWGKGVPGHDSTEGVRRHRQEVQAAHERWARNNKQAPRTRREKTQSRRAASKAEFERKQGNLT